MSDFRFSRRSFRKLLKTHLSNEGHMPAKRGPSPRRPSPRRTNGVNAPAVANEKSSRRKFPRTPVDIELAYENKAAEGELLHPPSTIAIRGGKTIGKTSGRWVNRLIHGDNLAVMQALLRDEQIAGRITLAYIDPPFSSMNDFRAGKLRTSTMSKASGDQLAYQDHLQRAEYLEFLRRRLIVLRELLGEQGAIWVHIGHQMSHYVRVLLDEVFGPENFLNEITRVKCNPKNFLRRAFGNVKDSLLYYSKTGCHVWNEQREMMSEDDLDRLFPRADKRRRRYTTTPLHAPGETRQGATGQNWMGQPPPPGRHWRYAPAELTRLDQAGMIEWSARGNPRKIVYADDIRRAGKKRQDIWTFKDPAYPSYPTEKNLSLLETIILTSSNPGDLVLDCFAGSGTTLAAAAMHGRRWIGIDGSAVAMEKAGERLKGMSAARPFRLDRVSAK